MFTEPGRKPPMNTADQDNAAIVNTTLAHFGGTSALAMIGGQAMRHDSTLTIRFKARAKNKANQVHVAYSKGSDLYEVSFLRVSRGAVPLAPIGTTTTLSADALRSHFTCETGLYLSL